jgi:hypothetical protein
MMHALQCSAFVLVLKCVSHSIGTPYDEFIYQSYSLNRCKKISLRLNENNN